ncbi:hypothetical protein A176_004864 [Myxococcus hansupus]|uniref:Lipoprotein n=1 Tax=Pseudomyxococcus hansupus TaxID=1297742 RepID=A0A0H4XI74_9BACT|nr:hypothetical protein [Myxococcus hansupus]AKQ67952.1 hypothetical protein A176_004864 [Myxococcus hansupus]
MPHTSRLSFLAVFALVSCLYAKESLAQNAQGGAVRHDAYVTVPNGTVNDWALHVSPSDMGFEEHGSEGDNAFIKMECYAVPVNQYTWRIVARYKSRHSNGRDGIWYSGGANYLLVRK